jgi:hypothetical protein
VIELEDTAEYGPILQDMADILNDGVANGFAKPHARQLMKNMVNLLQLAEVI